MNSSCWLGMLGNVLTLPSVLHTLNMHLGNAQWRTGSDVDRGLYLPYHGDSILGTLNERI